MTTTRISHTGHNHPSTTAARTACRKAMKATPVATAPATRLACVVGKGKMIHEANMANGQVIGAMCGAGLQRGLRRESSYTAIRIPADAVVSCHRCR